MNNIHERSSKEELISAACEIVDTQAQQITELQEQQRILIAVAGALLVWVLV